MCILYPGLLGNQIVHTGSLWGFLLVCYPLISSVVLSIKLHGSTIFPVETWLLELMHSLLHSSRPSSSGLITTMPSPSNHCMYSEFLYSPGSKLFYYSSASLPSSSALMPSLPTHSTTKSMRNENSQDFILMYLSI